MTRSSLERKPRVFVDEYHGESLFSERLVRELRRAGYDVVKFTQAYTYDQLVEFEVYAVWFTRYRGGECAEFTEVDQQVVKRYIESGGCALLIGLGWAWTDYEQRPSIDDYPLNLIADDYGVYFTAAMIDSVAGVHYRDADITFFQPFIADHPVTLGVERIGSPDSAPATLIVSSLAVPLIWGSDDTRDSDGARNPVILAAAPAGQGKIVCLQHVGFVTYMGYDNFALLTNILRWLVSESDDEIAEGTTTPIQVLESPPIEDESIATIAESVVRPTIGLITALPIELAAVRSMLDNVRSHNVSVRNDTQRYFLGEVLVSEREYHQVVVALTHDMGTNFAAELTSRLLNHFPTVNDVIMVGIAGGVPHPERPNDHVRLGDIVVSDRNGIVQYDFIKEEIQESRNRHPPRPPSPRLLDAVRLMEADDLEGRRPWLQHIERAAHLYNASRPSEEADNLRDFAYPDLPESVPHPLDPRRIPGQPRVFLGTIASANTLLKNPDKRDELRDRFGVKAVEMEGSGIADATWSEGTGYLVIRGICDYCDPDKTDDWQQYAAIIAAAYTRGLLESMPV